MKRFLSRILAATIMVGMIALESEMQGQPMHMTRSDEEADTRMRVIQEIVLDIAVVTPAEAIEMLFLQDPTILTQDQANNSPARRPLSSQGTRELMAKRIAMGLPTEPVVDMLGAQEHLETKTL